MKSFLIVGLLQAVGLAAYCMLVAAFMQALVGAFPRGPSILGVTLLLLLFVFSAVISGSIVLGYPASLVLRGSIREAVYTVVATVGWTAVLLLGVVLILTTKS